MRDVTSGPIQSLFQHIYIALCLWSNFHHLEQQKLPVSVQSVEGLEPAVLCQRVRDLHDVILSHSSCGTGSELVEEVCLLQKKFLEGPLAPFYQVLK